MRKFNIETNLNDQQLGEFRQFCADGRKTTDWLHVWLKDHGCVVARATVGVYRRHAKGTALAQLPSKFRIKDIAEARAKLAAWVNGPDELAKDDVMALARFAGFLAFNSGRGKASE